MTKRAVKVLTLLAMAFTLLADLIMPAPVYAIADPDSPPQVSAVYVYENLEEDGDVGVLIDYYLDYAALPDETATEAYIAVFVDTDGVTQLKAVAPYTYVTSGYRRGLIWIYFTADEVTAYSIDQANEALYEIWLMGNPTLAWAGDPPKTIAGIDFWQTTGDTATLVALRVLYYADLLEVIWVLDLIEVTALGNRLTTAGESYFENVIANCREIAPLAFSVSEIEPTIEELDYITSFGGTATSGVLAGSPVTLTEGTNNLNTTGVGSITFELNNGTSGDVTGAVVVGSPVDIVAGTNTVSVTGVGAIVVEVELSDTTTALEDSVIGTGFDLTTLAAMFGMSRWYFSGLVWMVLSVIICAAAYRGTPETMHGGVGKIIIIVFDICIVGGTLMGLLKPIVSIFLFIVFGALTGYILFFRGSSV